jgi:lysophospholipase L1-like esterase
MHKPLHTLVFGLIVFSTLLGLSFIFPPEGMALNDKIIFKFPSKEELFDHKETKSISNILKTIDEIDLLDSLGANTLQQTPQKQKRDSVSKLITHIQYKNKEALTSFFESLRTIKSSNQSIRVLHYGDSQIEGDRITDYLRLKLQALFGGQGPGLISLMPISPSVTNRIINGPGWDRYGVFTSKDTRIAHNNFGVMAGFTRFMEPKKLYDTSETISTDLTVSTTKMGGANAMAYKKIKMFYGGSKTKTWCEFYDGPALVSADSLNAGGLFNIIEYQVGLGSLTHSFKFSGKDSPDFYGLSLENDKGVYVDNIALRGSSGTFFHQINAQQLKDFYNLLNVKLIILQFGGNVLPSLKDATMAATYGNYIKNQITIVKKIAPKASILFIGPSDMCIKQGTNYITYPFLEETRNAIKKAVLESNCAFFDMYDCMGGRNSMPSWVEQNLASTDYTHFSPQGARKIATLLYTALINEYNSYTANKK